MKSSVQHYSIGAVNISLRSDVRRFAREYASLYESYRCDEAGPGAIDVEILARHQRPWPRGPYTLRSRGAVDFEVSRRCEVLPHLEWYINWQIIHGRPEFVQLHASALEMSGQSLILPGDPGSGKSTLTAGLLTRGWSYLCDEFALIDAWSGKVNPYPRALCIKEGSFGVVEKLGIPLQRKTPYQKPTKGRVAFLNPLDVDAGIVGRPSPVRWVVFPKYVSGATTQLRPMARSQCAYMLAKQCFNIRVDQRASLACLANVVRKADCFQLVFGDIHDACDLVEWLPFPRTSRKAG